MQHTVERTIDCDARAPHEIIKAPKTTSGVPVRRQLPPLLDVALYFFILMGAADMYVEFAIKPDTPQLSSAIQSGSVRVGKLERSYRAFIPAHLAKDSPLLLVFHGSAQTPEEIRMWTGYEFDRLADKYGFAVVYPVGYQANWNDCRKKIAFPARTHKIDDKALTKALIARFHDTAGIDTRRVFAVGFSNGGHFAYRLALEMPDEIAGVAAVAANAPTEDNNLCDIPASSVPVLIMNGTGDPINPFVGGEVALYGLGSRGTVRSSEDSAKFFAHLNGVDDQPVTIQLPHPESRDATTAERLAWGGEQPKVLLFRIHKGGHVFPQPNYRAPRMMGYTSHCVNGPEEIWKFFSSLPPGAG